MPRHRIIPNEDNCGGASWEIGSKRSRPPRAGLQSRSIRGSGEWPLAPARGKPLARGPKQASAQRKRRQAAALQKPVKLAWPSRILLVLPFWQADTCGRGSPRFRWPASAYSVAIRHTNSRPPAGRSSWHRIASSAFPPSDDGADVRQRPEPRPRRRHAPRRGCGYRWRAVVPDRLSLMFLWRHSFQTGNRKK